MRRFVLAILLPCLVTLLSAETDPEHRPYLFQDPTVNGEEIVFVFAANLWRVPRAGGDAIPLTSAVGVERGPRFSPDGTSVAFTGEYDGNTDVFVIPATGGVPRRLTHHPSPDVLVGWTPGGRVIFASTRASFSGVPKLFTVGAQGGSLEELPLPQGVDASFSPDGERLAYVPTAQWQRAWKRYRGGQTSPIWITDLTTLEITRIPRENTNDFSPMWIGDSIYFLSDRGGPVTLFRYDLASERVEQVIENRGLDFKAASAGPGVIAYEQFGALFLYDLQEKRAREVRIGLAGDLPEVRRRYVKVKDRIASAGLSPSGKRAVFEARGEILTVPAAKGDIRNLTRSPGVMERSPSWSPDGRWIAYLSDASGEYELHLKAQSGKEDAKKIRLADAPTFFYDLTWSPDSRKIAFADKRLRLSYLDVEAGEPVHVATTPYFSPVYRMRAVWSHDSEWIAYHRQLESHLSAVFVYSLRTGETHQVTDGLSDARYPAFDASGRYLYFTASTDVGLTSGWLNMTSMNRPVTRSVYLTVLRKDLPSPLAPESDEEEPEAETDGKTAGKSGGKDGESPENDKGKKSETEEEKSDSTKERPEGRKEPEKVVIDLEGISQRILALPIPPRNYTDLVSSQAGVLFVVEAPEIGTLLGNQPLTVHRFDLKERKTEKLIDGVQEFLLAAKGEKMLYRRGDSWVVAGTKGPPKPGEGTLDLESMQVYIDPPAEWRQMYEEVWRLERDFFYDPDLHGLDLETMKKRYEGYLDRLASRHDLNYLFEEMLGELTCGHVFVAGGDTPRPERVAGGLLGADYAIENGRYRFARIYDGENWNPELRAPLTQPGLNVREGEYLLEVEGRPLSATDDVFRHFEATADRSVRIRVGPNPDGTDSREITVVPLASERALRSRAWIEGNRRKVEELSGGRLAYVYLPDTATGGYASFNRYFFSQVGREGAVIDERFNGGGLIADYIVDYLARSHRGYFTHRDGKDYATPVGAIYGPKAMIINEYAGSGGDMLPWLFRREGIGPLIGRRTWGGLVGVALAAQLMDGGFTGAPQSGFWNPNGTWDVENHGVDPDIEVEMHPAAAREGRDPQLERAVDWLLQELERHPLPRHTRPEYPDYHGRRF